MPIIPGLNNFAFFEETGLLACIVVMWTLEQLEKRKKVKK